MPLRESWQLYPAPMPELSEASGAGLPVSQKLWMSVRLAYFGIELEGILHRDASGSKV